MLATGGHARYQELVSIEPRLYATLIERLSDVEGVVACAAFAAFAEGGECLSCLVGEKFEALGTGRIIPSLRDIATSTDASMPFEEGVTFFERHLVRVLVRRTPLSTFVVLIEPDGDVDLVAAHLARVIDVVARASRAPSSVLPPAQASSSSLTMPPPPTPGRTASGIYERTAPASDSSELAERPSSPPLARVVDEEAVLRLQALALDNLGFAADVVFERMKASVENHAGQVPRGRWLELVGRLASEIDDDDVREKFVETAMALQARTKTNSDALELLSPLAKFVVGKRTG